MGVDDMTVRLLDATRATVLATIHTRMITGSYSYRHEYRLVKRDEHWLIVETIYHHPLRAPQKVAWPDVV